MRELYPTDLSDTEWTRLRSYLPTPKAQGRPRTYSLRDVLDAIFYVLKSGCPWRFLPHEFPPWSTVYYHFRRFRLSGLWSLILKVLHAAERKRAGKDPQPTVAIMDSQSVKTVEESAHPSGYDAHKNVKGRKRHLLVDTLGLPLSIYVTSADVQDRVGAQCLLAGITVLLPRLKKIWADGAYTGEKLAGWCKEQGGWELEIVERSSADTEGFAVLPYRWLVERTFGWLMRNRRLSKDYERLAQTSETFIEVAMIRLILRRLGGEREPYQTVS
jgi:putative transposase